MNRNIYSVAALALALQAIALPVAAEVVVYDNTDGTFLWGVTGLGSLESYFDPTKPPSQSGERTQPSLTFQVPVLGCSECIGIGSFVGVGEIEMAVGESFVYDGFSRQRRNSALGKQSVPAPIGGRVPIMSLRTVGPTHLRVC
jgi:hypothetical protein